ncbi:MAG: hypothetical protein Q8Q32_01630 [bacterium]|nr:hypothetical protein [bacterium]
MQNNDPQSQKYKRKLSDIQEGREIKTDFSKEERRARLNKEKDNFSDYPTEIIIIAILLVLIILYAVTGFFQSV